MSTHAGGQRVLVTGAGGYVGSRLVPALLAAGHEVVASFSRGRPPAGAWWADRVEVRGMDVHDPDQVREAVQGVDAAFYLIHGLSGRDFAASDREAAISFGGAAARAGVGRLVYLSGLVPAVPEDRLSPHIASRLEVERLLAESGVPTTTLRAAIVVGSGSTSFEIVRHISERMPVQTVPTWMGSDVQPIAVVDVVDLLVRCLDLPLTTRTYDVGGPERLRYAELLGLYAEVARIIRPRIPVPLVPSVLVGQIAGRLTGVPTGTVAALVESLKHDMVCGEQDFLDDLVPEGRRLVGVREAVTRALTRPLAGTRPEHRDPVGPLPTDPEWAGGGVYLFDGEARRRGTPWWERALLGPTRPGWPSWTPREAARG